VVAEEAALSSPNLTNTQWAMTAARAIERYAQAVAQLDQAVQTEGVRRIPLVGQQALERALRTLCDITIQAATHLSDIPQGES
jgi:hypothetical protein